MTVVASDRVAAPALVRAAQASDNAARCDLFARVVMESDLVLSVRREPDFDALYRLQSRDWLSLVAEIDGAIEGTATILLRDGYIGGVRRRVGYLGDLRFSPKLEGRFVLERFFRPLLEQVRERFGVELFLTAVIASNERARRALTHETPRSRRAGRPLYTFVGDFDIRSLHLLLPRRTERSAFHVRRASEADVPAVARLLDADARRRPFGFVFGEGELERRLRDWPGLSIQSFYLAENESQDLVGCFALWDAAPVKRMIVGSYRGPMRRARFAYDVAATVLRMPKMPRPGGEFRYQYVTHQAIPSDDPRILRALIARAYADVRGTGYHFLSICAPKASPLAPAFGGFHVTNLPAQLYVVALPGLDVSRDIASSVWPGFEMALV